MRICLEPADLQAIADEVVRKLTPLILKAQEAAGQSMSSKVAKMQVLQPESLNLLKPKSDVIRRNELCLITGLSATTLWRLERDGEFPARIRLTNSRVGWRRSEIEKWLASRVYL